MAESDTTGALNEELAAAAAAGNDVVLNQAVANDNTPVQVPAGQTLTLANGAALDGGAYDVQGTMTVEANTTATNNAYISVNSTNSLHVYGTLNNAGIIYVGDDREGAMTVSGRVNNTGSIQVGGGQPGTLTVSGILDMGNATLNLSGSSAFVSGGGTITGSSDYVISTEGGSGSYTIENVTVTGSINGINISFGKSVTLAGVKIYSNSSAITNSIRQLSDCAVTIQDCTISGDPALDFASAADETVTITVSGSSISGAFNPGNAVVSRLDEGSVSEAKKVILRFWDSDGATRLMVDSINEMTQEFVCGVPMALTEFRAGDRMAVAWKTVDGTTEYLPGQAVTFTDPGTIDLHAVWGEAAFTVTFDLNEADFGQTTPASISVPYGDSFTLPAEQFTKRGYRFVGWSRGQYDYSSAVAPGGTIKMEESFNGTELQLFAVWAVY